MKRKDWLLITLLKGDNDASIHRLKIISGGVIGWRHIFGLYRLINAGLVREDLGVPGNPFSTRFYLLTDAGFDAWEEKFGGRVYAQPRKVPATPSEVTDR